MKKISSAHLLWEPRRVPLMKETLGISQRDELARLAMAAPINHDPRLAAPVLADSDNFHPNRRQFLTQVGLALCAWIVLLGLGFLVWAWL